MQTNTGKRTAKVRTTLTKRVIEALEPTDTSWIAWDDKLTGFGIRVHPGGAKSFIVNYRAGDGGRKAPNKRVVIGRYGKVTADQARRQAQKILGKVADGDDPAEERAEARSMPTLGDTFEEYMTANPNRSKRTNELYRYEAKRYLGDWLKRPIDAITRRDVETRFNGCQWRSKKGPPRRCKKGPLGGCGLVPVVHGRAPRATRRALNRLTRRRAREGPVGPRGQAWAGWSVQLAVGV